MNNYEKLANHIHTNRWQALGDKQVDTLQIENSSGTERFRRVIERGDGVSFSTWRHGRSKSPS